MKVLRVVQRILPGIMLWFQAGSQPAEGYYDAVNGLTGKALQQALHDIVDDHTAVTYAEIWSCFRTTDSKPDSTVWDMYSDVPGGTSPYTYAFFTNQCGNYTREGDCYNREHAFPKSWFGDAEPMITDLFHIYPTDGWVNNKRGNLPFGETSKPSWTSANGSKVGPCSWPGYTATVFEPIPEYKGDFARTILYMATRYYGEDGNWPGSGMVTGAEPKPWALDMLLAWHRKDTVSIKEINRNNEVFKFQKNRNPFIDRPLFAEMIWGTPNPVFEPAKEEIRMVLYPNPVKEMVHLQVEGGNYSTAHVTIFDMSGATALQTITEMTESSIPVDGLQPGLYILRVVVAGGTYTCSFVKMSAQ